jgi:putative heme utilization radical SAM enzyme HutW
MMNGKIQMAGAGNTLDEKTSSIHSNKPWELFPDRIRSAAEIKARLPINKLGTESFKNALSEKPDTTEKAMYIHIPFCNNLCDFCGYYKSKLTDTNQLDNYIQNLLRELKMMAEEPWTQQAVFHAVYFGGGTPGILTEQQFASIIDCLRKNYKLHKNCEISLESSITEIAKHNIIELRKIGINRMSLGVQSFNTNLRQTNSRISSTEEILAQLCRMQDAGIRNICVDLIYNLKNQSLKHWEEDLEMIEKQNLSAASIYPLLPFPNAPIVRNKEFKNLSMKEEYAFFKMADDFLTKLENWKEITSVQYGHSQKGTAKYIELQANNSDILAFGPGAGGKINQINYLNQYGLEYFMQKKNNDYSKVFFYSFNSSNNQLGAIMKLARSLRISAGELKRLYEVFPDKISLLINHNLIRQINNDYQLTQKGKFWSANIINMFL